MQFASTQKPETKMTSVNPIIAEILRGSLVESHHRGAFAVCDASGKPIQSMGNIATAVYPRSAIKAFQALPMLQSGAADRFGLTPEEIALCCSSHDGEPEHVRVARSILSKAGNTEHDLECGSHWPSSSEAMRALVKADEQALSIHNNCSGKHGGMLALARQLDVDVRGYVKPDHPVQKEIARAYGAICGLDLSQAPMAIDGCSVPTWALPLSNVATGFAKLIRMAEGQRIIASVRAHPFMVAGTTRYDTKIMQSLPRLFIKLGAEGVFCGCIPHAGLGFALKCDDGAYRGAEVAVAEMLLTLDVWTSEEKQTLATFATRPLRNWRKLETGLERASF
jgi:L-asparaginase II